MSWPRFRTTETKKRRFNLVVTEVQFDINSFVYDYILALKLMEKKITTIS